MRKKLLDFYLAAAVSTGGGCDLQLAQSDPLLQVVGEAGPEHFHLRFGQAAQVELAQSQFAFDPGVAELDHAAASAILLLRLGRGHLLAEGDHGRGFFGAQQAAAAMLIAGTALGLERTVLTVLSAGFVMVFSQLQSARSGAPLVVSLNVQRETRVILPTLMWPTRRSQPGFERKRRKQPDSK